MRCARLCSTVLALVFLIAFNAQASRKSGSSEEILVNCKDGESRQMLLPGAERRIGVFAFEDQDNTGLGEYAAELFAREILITASASRIGVINFTDSLAPDSQRTNLPAQVQASPTDLPEDTAQPQLSYYDKVEQVSSCQQVVLALWGIIRATAAGVSIESYIQVPNNRTANTHFTASVNLNGELGDKELRARVSPDRMQVYQGEFTSSDIKQLRQAVKNMNRLRERPDEKLKPKHTLNSDNLYYVAKKEKSWVQLSGGRSIGWVPRRLCSEACGKFLAAANFTGEVLQYLAGGRIPQFGSLYGVEAAAVAAQLRILDNLKKSTPASIERARAQAACWLEELGQPQCKSAGSSSLTTGDLLPGGAALANLQLMVAATQLNNRQPALSAEEFRAQLKPLVYKLAEASQRDPRNTHVLQNLAVLFSYLGDSQRAGVADRLAKKYETGAD
ncbi:MAG: hypothetical protein AB8B48_21820 [Pseudomonadales bacterium]